MKAITVFEKADAYKATQVTVTVEKSCAEDRVMIYNDDKSVFEDLRRPDLYKRLGDRNLAKFAAVSSRFGIQVLDEISV